jgi:maltose-binding protein MalE
MKGMFKLLREKRGISELVMVLIMISLALVGGGLAYAILGGTVSSVSSNVSLELQSAEINASATPKVVAVVVKNNGSVAITSATVKFYADSENNVTLTISNIVTGQTKSASQTTTLAFESGKTYTVVLEADAANGGKISKTVSVLAK